RVDLRVEPFNHSTAASVDDHGWGSIATASLGAEFNPFTLPGLRAGLDIELGYVATSAITLHASPSDRGPSDRTIDTPLASIGPRALGGGSGRMGGHLDF